MAANNHCKRCGQGYRADGRGNLCGACYEQTVEPQFRARTESLKLKALSHKPEEQLLASSSELKAKEEARRAA